MDDLEDFRDMNEFYEDYKHKGWSPDEMYAAFMNRKSLGELAKLDYIDLNVKAVSTLVVQKLNREFSINGADIDKEFKVASILMLLEVYFNVDMFDGTPLFEEEIEEHYLALEAMAKEFASVRKIRLGASKS